MIHGAPGGRRCATAKEILVQWLVKAWGAIPSAMIEYSYKKCGISNNGTDDITFEDAGACGHGPRCRRLVNRHGYAHAC